MSLSEYEVENTTTALQWCTLANEYVEAYFTPPLTTDTSHVPISVILCKEEALARLTGLFRLYFSTTKATESADDWIEDVSDSLCMLNWEERLIAPQLRLFDVIYQQNWNVVRCKDIEVSFVLCNWSLLDCDG
jgi:hypothetical protein